ncbi:hypothetical protein BDK51DRAFT_32912, partial [Blyttiomyces helicus]
MSRNSRVVFVGNIPYDLTEPQLIDIFKEVGPVVSLRLVFDRDTGKPKGYGFCTFPDAETAASAVRNLNNYDVGGRQLRIDFAESDKDDMPDNKGYEQKMKPYPPPMPQKQPMPAPTYAPQKLSSETISAILGTFPPNQIMEVLSAVKLHVQTNPDSIRALLTENPQLSYALFQALLIMNIVEPGIMQ